MFFTWAGTGEVSTLAECSNLCKDCFLPLQNLKEPVAVAVVASVEAVDMAEEVAVEVEVVVAAALEEAGHPVWEDCSRPECRS